MSFGKFLKRLHMWRVLVLTYPIWGIFIATGLLSFLYGSPRSSNADLLGWIFLLPMLATPVPLWVSDNRGLVAKVILTPVLYVYAFVAYIFMVFGIGCQVFRYSCAMG